MKEVKICHIGVDTKLDISWKKSAKFWCVSAECNYALSCDIRKA